MTLPHTSREYAAKAEYLVDEVPEGAAETIAANWIATAQVYATLAVAAATIESTTPPNDLDLACPATTERELYRHEDAEAGDVHDCVRYRGHITPHRCRVCAYEWPTEQQEQAAQRFYCQHEWEAEGRPLLHPVHRCASAVHEGQIRPHLCACGSEL
jgi:hypothetical protein